MRLTTPATLLLASLAMAACRSEAECNDADADTICDDVDLCEGDDATGDTDSDGICDDSDLCEGDDATGDADSDGICDDTDLCEGDNATGDTDSDGLCDDIDTDDDGDGCEDALDADPLVTSADEDDDGIAEDCDLCLGDDATGDTDSDGTCDDTDADDDDDGCDDGLDANPLVTSTDEDDDGIAEDCDLCLGDDATGDTDSDGTCDDLDTDDDNDGCDDTVDSEPLAAGDDTDADGVADECDLCDGDDATGDTDSDGLCDDTDEDDDGDGCSDSIDPAPLVASDDADEDGLGAECDSCFGDNESGDDDEDGVCNNADFDSDNDGCEDVVDANPTTHDSDADGDGLAHVCDLCDDDATSSCAVWGFSPYRAEPAYYSTVDFTAVYLLPTPSAPVDFRGVLDIVLRPSTGEAYALVRASDSSNRWLMTYNPLSNTFEPTATVDGTPVTLANRISSLAWVDDRLFAVSGDGGNPRETLYELDPETSELTLLTTLGNGDDGEVIAAGPDGLLYHASGLGDGDVIFETIDPDTLEISPLSPTLLHSDEVFGMVYREDEGAFWLSNISTEVWTRSLSGEDSQLGSWSMGTTGGSNQQLRGMLFRDDLEQ